MLATTVLLLATVVLAGDAEASGKYKTLHTFLSGDGQVTTASLIFDSTGNLYGTTMVGGAYDEGTVFELMPTGHGRWRELLLHSFKNDGRDGYEPHAGLVFDSAGNLYGTTAAGGSYDNGNGTVFELSPNGQGGWREKVIHSFSDDKDGGNPVAAVVFDAAGNLYGTMPVGPGGSGAGTVFQLSPTEGGTWRETILHSFKHDGKDGNYPYAALTFGVAGSIFGTTQLGGTYDLGTVFQLTPKGDGSWTETVIHSFTQSDGLSLSGGLVSDPSGSLYGTTNGGGIHGYGTVFKLKPNEQGRWVLSVLHSFYGTDGYEAASGVIFDSAGRLYGTTLYGGDLENCNRPIGCGVVFELQPTTKGEWTERVLHSFKDHPGAVPFAGLIFDGHSTFYGTTFGYGQTNGSVFEIVP